MVSGPGRGKLKTSVYWARNVAGSRRMLFPLLHLYPGLGSRLVRRSTQVVIEGFPRSANSFSVVAFQHWNPEVRAKADHLHVPAQVTAAARLGIPCAVLVRRPSEALASLLVADPSLSINVAVWSWINFYRRAAPVRDRIAVCTFDEVIADPGVVVDRLNARFGTRFRRGSLTEEERAALFSRLKNIPRRERFRESLVPVPSRSRDEAKRRIMHLLADHSGLDEADALYREWSAAATRDS